MRKLSTLLFVFGYLFGLSQNISFTEPEMLFTHPMIAFDREPNTESPFTPVDYNQDGLIDFIGNGDDGIFRSSIYFLEANSETSFHKDSIETGSDNAPYAQTLDFDKDGQLDILFNDFIYFFDRKEKLTIPLPENYDSFVTFDHYLGAEDFNGDGKYDIIVRRVISGEPNELAIYLSNPTDDNFENLILQEGGDFADFEVVDLNQDGFLDLVSVELHDLVVSYINIYYNDGKANFKTQGLDSWEYFYEANYFSNLEIADMDGDTDLDIVYADDFSGISILENTGSTDNGEMIYAVPANESPIQFRFSFIKAVTYVVEDMNKDGRPDFVVVDNKGYLHYAENQGALSFTSPLQIAKTNEPFYVYSEDRFFDLAKLNNNLHVIDFDGDQDMDVLYLDGNTGEQWLIRSELIISSVTNANLISNHLVEAYPNPTTSQVTLYSESYMNNGLLYSLNGELLENFPINASSKDIYIGHLPAGMYLLQIQSESHQTNLKIVVE